MNIEAKLLKGLKFRDSVKKEVIKDGQKVYQYIPRERDLKSDDVLSSKDYGDTIVIVTSDGQKITIPREGKTKREEER